MLYQRYLIGSTISYFFLITFSLVSLIWFSRSTTFLKYIIENSVEIKQFLILFVLILPWFLLIILPISLFLAILFNFNRLNSNNELTILKSSGISNNKISSSIFLLAILITIICYFISFFLMPNFNKKLKNLRHDITNNYSNFTFNPKTFESLRNLTFYSKDRNEKNELSGILINDQRSSEYTITITAETGNIVSENNSVLLYMNNGTIQKFNFDSQKTDILNFDKYIFNLNEQNHQFDKKILKVNELYFHELLNNNLELNPKEKVRVNSEIIQRIIDPLAPMILTLIALIFSIQGELKRKQNYLKFMSAIMVGLFYYGLNIMFYNLIISSKMYMIAPFVNLIFFAIFGLRFLNKNFT